MSLASTWRNVGDFSIYDGFIIAAAVRAGCSIVYTEDMQHEQAVGRLAIRNPFV